MQIEEKKGVEWPGVSAVRIRMLKAVEIERFRFRGELKNGLGLREHAKAGWSGLGR
jgi:hypothetical protein